MPKKSIDTYIYINTTIDKVWKTLLNFRKYPQWNPFITSIEGIAEAGNRLKITMKPPGGKAMSFSPKVIVVQKNRALVWKGSFIIPGLFDGEHRFILEELSPRRVMFRQTETFSGILLPFMSTDRTEKGFKVMNEAIKAQAEAS